MRVLSLFLLALASCLSARPAGARPVSAEPSMYGKFDVIHTQATCAVSFTLTGKKPRVLFATPDCSANGTARLSAVESAGEAGLPATAASGEELHVFSIASARSGSAVPVTDFWVVVVKRKGVWSGRAAFQSRGLDSVTTSSTRRAVFTLEQNATTVSEGLRWTVSFGALQKRQIPRIPSTVVSQAKRTYVGDLSGGSPVAGERPSLRVGDHRVVIHEDGKCRLPGASRDFGRVELDAEVTRWSDDRELVRCIAVRKAPGAPPRN